MDKIEAIREKMENVMISSSNSLQFECHIYRKLFLIRKHRVFQSYSGTGEETDRRIKEQTR